MIREIINPLLSTSSSLQFCMNASFHVVVVVVVCVIETEMGMFGGDVDGGG
jgi:hypothetical protein